VGWDYWKSPHRSLCVTPSFDWRRLSYRQFLNEVLPELLEEVRLVIRREMWYLHDGAPPHYARQVRIWMDISFPNRWIGRAGPILWPPQSPCLNPCDFFVWGYMKQLVYATAVNTIWRTCEFKTPLRKFVKTEAFWIEFGFLGHIVLKLALQTVPGILSNFFDVLFYFYSHLQFFYFVV
jgi:hypothetical protein